MTTINKITRSGITANASQNRELKDISSNPYYEAHNDAHAAAVHTAGDSAHNAGPTPTECGDRWEPLREKLSISEAQYLNTYTRTGDIAALNCLVLGIISQRDETAAECDLWRQRAVDECNKVADRDVAIVEAREQVKTLLAACKNAKSMIEQFDIAFEDETDDPLPIIAQLGDSIASVENAAKESEGQ